MPDLEPITRRESIIAGEDIDPVTREEWFLKKYGGGGGGGIVEGPFSLTNETTDSSGTYDATIKAEVTDKKINYADVELDKTSGDIKKFFSAQFDAPSPTNRSSKVILQSYSVDNSDVATSAAAVHTSTSTKFTYSKGTTSKYMIVDSNDITTDDHHPWVNNLQSLREALSFLSHKDKTATLVAGQTSLTIQDSSIKTNSTIDYYTSVFGVNPTNAVVTTGQIVLTFEAQQSDIDVKVRIS